MTLYHKIQAPFKRSDTKPHNVLWGEWTSPELEYLANNLWRWTEKVDGTNIRVIWDGYTVTFGGRTDNAQIPKKLQAALDDLFLAPGVEELFEQTFGEDPAVIYGEGCGAGIQKNGARYGDTPRFIAFDVRVGDWWLRPDDLWDVAHKLGLQLVPYMGYESLHGAIKQMQAGPTSHFGPFLPEGWVGTPAVPLQTRAGKRLIVKVKTADFYVPDAV